MASSGAAPIGAASRPIVLIGMMGSGKSTVGRRLAARLGRRYVDADRFLEERCGVAIATIFELAPVPMDDNLRIPLSAGFAMTLLP